MQFVIYAKDKPNNLERRMEVRPSHLEYWGKNSDKILLAGPLLDENDKPCGSTLIVEGNSLEEVRALAEADPYWTDGVFGTMDITATNLFLGKLAPQGD
ncbi:MAG: YciI family protein [Alphaproteobacteria bacterium]|nr:MAG: YciI family protein [Alphaproteobacteria bacterium]